METFRISELEELERYGSLYPDEPRKVSKRNEAAHSDEFVCEYPFVPGMDEMPDLVGI